MASSSISLPRSFPEGDGHSPFHGRGAARASPKESHVFMVREESDRRASPREIPLSVPRDPMLQLHGLPFGPYPPLATDHLTPKSPSPRAFLA